MVDICDRRQRIRAQMILDALILFEYKNGYDDIMNLDEHDLKEIS